MRRFLWLGILSLFVLGIVASVIYLTKVKSQPSNIINDKISVILPIYNSEPWLDECLNSIINQGHKNLEIICVNDGSKDKSLLMLKEYQQKDNRIIIIDQKNQGVSAARNAGIRASTGEYLAFVDSDDYIDLNTYEICMNKIKETGADIVAFDYTCFPLADDTRVIPAKTYINDSFTAIKEDYSFSCIWNKVYSRSLITYNGLHFKEDVDYGEDDLFNLMLFPKANNIVLIPQKLYYYRQRENSLTSTKAEIKAISRVNHSKYLVNDWQAHEYDQNTWMVCKVSWMAKYIEEIKNNSALKLSLAKEAMALMDNRLLNIVDIKNIHNEDKENIEKLKAMSKT